MKRINKHLYKLKCSFKNEIRDLFEFFTRMDLILDKYLKGDKEIWEYEEVSEVLKFAVRILTLVMPAFFYIIAGVIFYLSLEGVQVEGLGVLVAAIIAGSFAMLSSIGNTEANIRSLRSSWIEESRKDLAKYITSSRRYLIAAEKFRKKRLELIRKRNVNESAELNVSSVDLRYIKDEVELKENEAIEAQMNFFESYAAINVKYRSIKKGTEAHIFNDLKEHYNKYREVCGILCSERSVYKKVNKGECYELDTKLGDRFGSYFIEEWKRAKKGDKELIAKKNIIISILTVFVLSYGYNVIMHSFNFEVEETESTKEE